MNSVTVTFMLIGLCSVLQIDACQCWPAGSGGVVQEVGPCTKDPEGGGKSCS